MMEATMRNATIRARTEEWLKEEVEGVLKELGMTPTEAINLFYNQIRLQRGLPFNVLIPNEETAQVLRDTDDGKNLVKYNTIEDMFKDLDS
jgi:DNA-damage-inducible protein J